MMIKLLLALDFEAVGVELDFRECFLRSVLQALKSELLAFGCHSAQSLRRSAIQKFCFIRKELPYAQLSERSPPKPRMSAIEPM